MKIIAIEKEVPGKTAADFQPHLEDEARVVWGLYQQGSLREIYFRADQNSAILVLECTDVHTAEDVLSTLPLVREGLIEFEIIPLIPYPGFKRLFKTESNAK